MGSVRNPKDILKSSHLNLNRVSGKNNYFLNFPIIVICQNPKPLIITCQQVSKKCQSHLFLSHIHKNKIHVVLESMSDMSLN